MCMSNIGRRRQTACEGSLVRCFTPDSGCAWVWCPETIAFESLSVLPLPHPEQQVCYYDDVLIESQRKGLTLHTEGTYRKCSSGSKKENG